LVIDAEQIGLTDQPVGPSTYINPIRNTWRDYVLTYDPDSALGGSANNTREVNVSQFGMFLAAWYLPNYVTDNSIPPNWRTVNAQAVTERLPSYPTGPPPVLIPNFCQTNTFDYRLINCTDNTIQIPTGTFTNCIPLISATYRACEGWYAVCAPPSLPTNEACHLTIHWQSDNVRTVSPNSGDLTEIFQLFTHSSWSASIEWLNDPRSDASIFGLSSAWRIMLLDVNHTF
jgi:hypothetical protein